MCNQSRQAINCSYTYFAFVHEKVGKRSRMSREKEEISQIPVKGEYICIFIMLALSAKLCTLSNYDNQAHFKSLSGLCYELIIYIIYMCACIWHIYIHTHSIYMYAYVCCILFICADMHAHYVWIVCICIDLHTPTL